MYFSKLAPIAFARAETRRRASSWRTWGDPFTVWYALMTLSVSSMIRSAAGRHLSFSRGTRAVSTPQMNPCSSHSRPSVLNETDSWLSISWKSDSMCGRQSSPDRLTRTLSALYAAMRNCRSSASGRWMTSRSACAMTVKNSETGEAEDSSARTWMTQQMFTATRGTSLSFSTRMGVRSLTGTMVGWNCAIRPRVQASVSRTATLGSRRVCTMVGKLCCTSGRIFSLEGPSMMEP
mmetsp:Transcript_13463/g.38283  ORF Transcript_13463/g.38283 Transcript_13463/m.38283 type:complete len:235 (+) Transcript_13463:796-1500(+)